MLANGLLQERVEFLTSGVERAFANRTRRQIPITLDAHFSIQPFEPLSRRQLLDSLHQGPRARNIVEREVAIETRETQAPLEFRMNENGFKFRTEEEIFSAPRDVKRLYTHAVARQNEPARRFAPQCDREHAPQTRKTFRVPFDECVQHGLGIGMRVKAVPQLQELAAHLEMIVNFPVEDKRGVAIIANDGLVSALEINDFQACRAHRNNAGAKHSALVRPAMCQSGSGAFNALRFRRPVFMCKAGYPAQIQAPFAG